MSYSYQKSDLTFNARERADGRYGFWWNTADTDLWADAKTDLKRSFNHGSGLRYDGDAREWTLPRYAVERLQRWADAWASQQEWNAAPRNGQQHRSERHQDAPAAPLTEAYATLHLLPSAPPELVTAAYRALAQLHHPDRGGDTGAMIVINRAVEILRDGAMRKSA